MKIFIGNSSYPEYFILTSTKKAFFITDTEKKAQECFANIKAYRDYLKLDIPVLYFPSDQNILDIKSQIDRNYTYLHLINSKKFIVVLSKEGLNVEVLPNDKFINRVLNVKVSQDLNRDIFLQKLYESGYIRVDTVEYEGEFSVKGGFITINIPYIGVVEIDLWGDTVENIFLRSKISTRKKLESVYIQPLYDKPVESKEPIKLRDMPTVKFKELIDGDIYLFDIYEEIYKEATYFYSLGQSVYSQKEIPQDYQVIKLPVNRRLILPEKKIAFIPEFKSRIDFEFEPLEVGDYVIHEDFGIGIYRGVETREIKGKVYDFMILEYADNEKVLVSYLHLDKIHKYKADGNIKIDKIGAPTWRNLKKKVKESLRNIAKQLVNLYAERNSVKRKPLSVDNEIIKAVEESFEFAETPDQLKVINEIKIDFQKDTPMDRLICGDVGFGKTEVAIRAAAIAVSNGYQVAVVVPTTVLSYQHYKKFKERLNNVGIEVENLSRLKTKSQQKEVLEKIKNGQIDVVIGTHRLLQDDVEFKNLGLLIIDEEHRFGVRAKEKLRQLKKDIDTLYISATPIPRTLNMVISKLKDISVINTPPEGRVEIKTLISPFDESVIKKAVDLELQRGGQVFFLHNKIQTIKERVDYLKTLFPHCNIDFIHGKMKPKEIEEKIIKFLERKIDILVSTSIIETGIDIPTANTLIVERADSFGLTQLYHIRGRVGRADKQAYCYILTPPMMTDEAKERIRVLSKLTRPGSGLKVSLEDLRIRGPGNILGIEQSGFIKAVGMEMYIKLLKEAIQEKTEEKTVDIDIDTDVYIPQDFIQDPTERFNITMALSKLQTTEEIESLREYLQEFYGTIPVLLNRFITIKKAEKLASQIGITKIEIKSGVLKFSFQDIDPNLLMEIIKDLKPLSISSNSISFPVDIDKLDIFLKDFENSLKKVKIDSN
ncbi:MAG: helicase-related protein [Hydrogenothermaceae bacterium]|nr:helicase-related protein [Hydrogenothermaceae bacterium]